MKVVLNIPHMAFVPIAFAMHSAQMEQNGSLKE